MTSKLTTRKVKKYGGLGLYSNNDKKLITLTIRTEKPIERTYWCNPIRSTFSAVNRALGLVSVIQIKIKRRRPNRTVSTPKRKIPWIVSSLLLAQTLLFSQIFGCKRNFLGQVTCRFALLAIIPWSSNLSESMVCRLTHLLGDIWLDLNVGDRQRKKKRLRES